jgi:hypothetical protein
VTSRQQFNEECAAELESAGFPDAAMFVRSRQADKKARAAGISEARQLIEEMCFALWSTAPRNSRRPSFWYAAKKWFWGLDNYLELCRKNGWHAAAFCPHEQRTEFWYFWHILKAAPTVEGLNEDEPRPFVDQFEGLPDSEHATYEFLKRCAERRARTQRQ